MAYYNRKDGVLSKTGITRRKGWNKKKFEYFVGPPDKHVTINTAVGIKKENVPVWHIDRIIFLENTEEFKNFK